MGQFRGRRRKALKQRRRKLKRMTRRVIAIGLAGVVDAFNQIRDAFVAFGQVVAAALRPFAEACVAINAAMSAAEGPCEELSLADLRTLAGGDGCAMPSARFTSEGGFTLN